MGSVGAVSVSYGPVIAGWREKDDGSTGGECGGRKGERDWRHGMPVDVVDIHTGDLRDVRIRPMNPELAILSRHNRTML